MMLPDDFRFDGHIEVAHAVWSERVNYCGHDGRCRADGARFTHALLPPADLPARASPCYQVPDGESSRLWAERNP